MLGSFLAVCRVALRLAQKLGSWACPRGWLPSEPRSPGPPGPPQSARAVVGHTAMPSALPFYAGTKDSNLGPRAFSPEHAFYVFKRKVKGITQHSVSISLEIKLDTECKNLSGKCANIAFRVWGIWTTEAGGSQPQASLSCTVRLCLNECADKLEGKK